MLVNQQEERTDMSSLEKTVNHISPYGKILFMNKVMNKRSQKREYVLQLLLGDDSLGAEATTAAAEFKAWLTEINPDRIVTTRRNAEGVAEALPQGQYIVRFSMNEVNYKGENNHLTVFDAQGAKTDLPFFNSQTDTGLARAGIYVVPAKSAGSRATIKLESVQVKDLDLAEKETTGGMNALEALIAKEHRGTA